MTLDAGDQEQAEKRRGITILAIVPIAAFALFVLFGWGLITGSNDLPSVLVGKPVPQFSLPAVQGRDRGLTTDDLIGQVALVNVFASWCVPCRAEHPLFMALSKTGQVPLYGINYKDKPDQAQAWLAELGDPYTLLGADLDGRVGIEWGVYGVPETYVIAADGTIAYRQVGQINQQILDEKLLPLVRKLQAKAGVSQ